MKKQLRYRFPLLIGIGIMLALLYGGLTIEAWQSNNKPRLIMRALITVIWTIFTVLNIVQYKKQQKARNNNP